MGAGSNNPKQSSLIGTVICFTGKIRGIITTVTKKKIIFFSFADKSFRSVPSVYFNDLIWEDLNGNKIIVPNNELKSS